MKPETKELIAAAAPLLPKTQETEISDAASFSGAVFNISTSMIGAGIMSIPATLKVLRIIPGFIVILIMGFLVEVTVEFLLRYTHSGESSTFGGLMAESFGKVGSVAIQLCCMISNLGALIIYLIIIGDVLSGNESEGTLHLGVLQEWFGIHWWNSRAYALLFIVIFVMLPLLLLPRVESLRHASALSILLAVVFIVISTVMAINAMFQGKSQKLRLVPDFANGVSVFQLFTTIPVFATGLACHVTIHPVRAELGKQSNMSSAVKISLLLTVTIYFAVGFIGYLLFGDSIHADMLVNFDQHSDSPIGLLVNDIVRLSYAIHLMLVFPVIHFTLRANVDELMFPKKPLLATDKTRFVSLTCIQLAFIYIVAIAVPNIWYFFQFMGSTTVACIAFVFPGTIVLRVPTRMADNPGSLAGGSHDSGGDQSPHSNVREQDRYLPIANINRIMKKALPANGKIAKDAKDTVQECVSEFISFITSEYTITFAHHCRKYTTITQTNGGAAVVHRL